MKAIIIGSTSGIGKAIAEKFAKENYLVGITGRTGEILEDMKQDHPNNFIPCIIDVKNTEDTLKKIKHLIDSLGGLDLLIICSGIGDINRTLDFKLEEETIKTNILGFTSIVDFATNYFINKGEGHLVALTSIAGLRGSALAPSYNASKSYQINYLEGVRQKLNKTNKKIIITDVRPGLVDTAMAKGEGLFWVAKVEKAANQICKAINKQSKVVYVTRRWLIIAIILKLIPRSLYVKM
jgi:short-subunit dehydrogenase